MVWFAHKCSESIGVHSADAGLVEYLLRARQHIGSGCAEMEKIVSSPFSQGEGLCYSFRSGSICPLGTTDN